jgi:probable HAF family extracellular repeat protein
MRSSLFIWTLAIIGGVAAAPAAGQVLYSIRDLGAFAPGGFSHGTDVNSQSQVTGYSNTAPSAPTRAFRTTPGGVVTDPAADLGTLGGASVGGFAINAAGQVAGYSELQTGSSTSHAFRTSPGGHVSDPGADLGTLGGASSYGTGINDAGQVAGYSQTANISYIHAFRTSPTGRVSDPGADLGPAPSGGNSYGQAINSSGQVAGYGDAGVAQRAFRSSPNGQPVVLTDLGTLGGFSSNAYGINDAGQVTGTSTTFLGQNPTAFRSSPNGQPVSLTSLGTLGGMESAGLDINNLGVVVGYSRIDDGIPRNRHAFIYDTRMRDLNNLIPPGSGWVLNEAWAISDSGLITGFGIFNGQTRAFLLTPIPEPSSLGFGGLALAGTCAMWRRRARRHTPRF